MASSAMEIDQGEKKANEMNGDGAASDVNLKEETKKSKPPPSADTDSEDDVPLHELKKKAELGKSGEGKEGKEGEKGEKNQTNGAEEKEKEKAKTKEKQPSKIESDDSEDDVPLISLRKKTQDNKEKEKEKDNGKEKEKGNGKERETAAKGRNQKKDDDDDDDSDDDVPLSSLKKKAPKKNVKKKRLILSDSEDEDRIEEEKDSESDDDDDDSDDDDVPLSMLKQKKGAKAAEIDKKKTNTPTTPKKTQTQTQTPKSTTTTAKSTPKAAATPKAKATPKATTPKAKATPKKKIVSDDDDDDEDDETDSDFDSKKKKTTKAKSTPRKRKRGGDDDESDSDFDNVKKTQAKKKKVNDDSDSDFESGKKTKGKKKLIKEENDDDDLESGDDDGDDVKKKKKGVKKGGKEAGKEGKSGVKKEKQEDKKLTAKEEKENGKVKVEKKPRGKKKEKEEDDKVKWWLETKSLGDDEKWKDLRHNGVLFAPLYVPHGVKPLYDGRPVTLTPEQEEYATYYAQYLETEHVKKEVFRNNFWKCWKKLLNPKKGQTPHVIRLFEKVDFRPIWNYLEKKKEEKKNRDKGEKEKEKEEKAKLAEKYGFADMDGVKERVGNYRVEPPGLFLGRGAHPKAGMFKLRITPADITINIGPGVPPPKPSPPYEDQEWGEVVSNNKVTWLAVWRENVNGSTKYVMFHNTSRLKGEADMKKFEVARRLKNNVERIREAYMKNLTSKKSLERQFATAMWVIDKLALRVGNEKGEDEADTVGCCSLRVEHITLIPPSSIQFDFLGKDSMRYFNTVQVDPQVYENFSIFMKGKKKTEDVFDMLNSVTLNAHLKKYMDGLSAKVFRTFNATFTLQKELSRVKFKKGTTVEEKVLEFNRANREVAILCNHQRSQTKQHSVQMEKMADKVKEIKDEIKKLKELKKELMGEKKGGKKGGKKKKDEDSESESESEDEKEKKKKEKEKKEKEKEKEKKEKEEKEKEKEKEKGDGKEKESRKRKRNEEEDDEEKKREKKKPMLPKTPEKCDDHIARLEDRLKKWKIKITEKDELKTIALNTSKINYIDPRLIVAWCKRTEVPVEKIFSKSLRDKFAWAMDVPEDWEF